MLTVKRVLDQRRPDYPIGIPSYCTANELVIEALFEQEVETDHPLLIEATANQVNQFGGYTGKQPADFVDSVYQIADRVGFPRERIILGGDHLGPLIWANEPEEEAMAKAKDLVKLFVEAGYRKIHLDTSMKLGDDSPDEPLSDEIIARRGIELFAVCEAAYQELKKADPDAKRPDFIIGSEVPIPGGAQEEEDSISVTKVEAVQETLAAYQQAFEDAGFDGGMDSVVGIVTQPGVEFGDDEVFQFDREAAKELSSFINDIPSLVMEGHSTDYQHRESLKAMVEEGVGILKVGPALTFVLREGLFALSAMEKELVSQEDRANLPQVLEAVMMENPSNWAKHYTGSDAELALKRKYSFSDRSRYYLTDERVVSAIEKLFANFETLKVPSGLLHQYMPKQYEKVTRGGLQSDGRTLVKDYVHELANDYRFACYPNLQLD